MLPYQLLLTARALCLPSACLMHLSVWVVDTLTSQAGLTWVEDWRTEGKNEIVGLCVAIA